jgi:hypothetical protein
MSDTEVRLGYLGNSSPEVQSVALTKELTKLAELIVNIRESRADAEMVALGELALTTLDLVSAMAHSSSIYSTLVDEITVWRKLAELWIGSIKAGTADTSKSYLSVCNQAGVVYEKLIQESLNAGVEIGGR